MRKIGWVVFALGLLCVPSLWAEEWTKNFTISGKADLRVKTSDANIRVETWDQNTIAARVTTERYKIGEGGIVITEHQTGDMVELEIRFPKINWSFEHGNRGGVEVEIHMPRQGTVNLHTGDGSIRLSNLKGTMELDSGDGSVEASSVDGVLRAHTGDGHIRAEGRFDGLDATTGDGHIETVARTGSSLGSGWNLSTGDGNVMLELPAKFAADVELQTGDGNIVVDAPVTVEGRMKSNHIHGKLNGGGGLLRVNTGDGSIELKNAGGI